ncbi:MAG: hypothetical protein IAF38_08280 [Bacteroidia bacterium]|nr:hypothetical protein [Bacteroidia bacterium]
MILFLLMMVIFKKYALLISFLVLTAGCTILFFYLTAEKKYFSIATTRAENRMLGAIILSTGLIGLFFNLISVYQTVSLKFKFITAIKLFFLNFPVMILQTTLVYGWFLLNGIF